MFKLTLRYVRYALSALAVLCSFCCPLLRGGSYA
jgi:hypothetical protein